jgi:hypothetical protein
MSLIYKDDIGVVLTVDTSNTAMPITTVLTLKVKKPDGTLVTLSPTVNYTTGILTYTTVSGDLNIAGTYEVQVNGVFTDGSVLRSNTDTFTVYEKLS